MGGEGEPLEGPPGTQPTRAGTEQNSGHSYARVSEDHGRDEVPFSSVLIMVKYQSKHSIVCLPRVTQMALAFSALSSCQDLISINQTP